MPLPRMPDVKMPSVQFLNRRAEGGQPSADKGGSSNKVADKMASVGRAVVDVPIDTLVSARRGMHDSEIRLGFEATEKMLNVVVKDAVRTEIRADPWAPACIEDVFMSAWEAMWPEIMAAVRDDYMLSHGSASHDGWLGEEMKKELDVTQWPPVPPVCPNPFRWLGARLLYALFPADKTAWYVVTHPLLLTLNLLAIFGPLGTATESRTRKSSDAPALPCGPKWNRLQTPRQST
jgi:hypothetical protein